MRTRTIAGTGWLGGLCLLLAFFALGTLPVNYAGLLLLGFSFLLFIADVFSPTHGVLTTGGVISFVLGSFMLFNTPVFSFQPCYFGSLSCRGDIARWAMVSRLCTCSPQLCRAGFWA